MSESPVEQALDFGSDGGNDETNDCIGIEQESYEDSLAEQHLARICQLEAIGEEHRVKALEHQKQNARILLSRVIKTPFDRNKKSLLVKFFLRWSKMLPLHEKCDELAKQLQDRLVAIASIRDSYLRDVVRVKYHLQKIQEFKLPGDDEPALIKQTGHDMYDLHVVPSISLRKLIDRAVEGNTSSMQLQETLIQAGLVNVGTGKAYNAWERGKNFPKIMKHNRGPNFKMPKTNGESISCSTPQTHELFVRYCKECVGIMQFVRAWNFEVEDSLRYKTEGQLMEVEINNLKETVNRLGDVIYKQEQRIISKDDYIKQLLESAKFMDQWSYQQEMQDREANYKAELKNRQNERGMALADRESTEVELNARRREDNWVWKLKNTRMKDEVSQAVEEMNEEKRLRLEMLGLLTSSQTTVLQQDTNITDLSEEIAEQKQIIASLREQLVVSERDKNRYLDIYSETSLKLDTLKMESSGQIQELKDEVTILTRDVEDKDAQINNQYDQMRDIRVEKDSVCDELEMLKADLARRLQIEMEAKIAADILSRKPKHSLKVIALVVRFSIRIMFGIKAAISADFTRLGPVFYHNHELKLNLLKLTSTQNELAETIIARNDLTAQNKKISIKLEKQLAMTAQQRQQLANERDRVKELTENLKKKMKEIVALEKTAVEKVILDQKRVLKIEELAKLLRRTQRQENLLRCHIQTYAHALTLINRMLFFIGPDVELSMDSVKPFISMKRRIAIVMIEAERKAKVLGEKVTPLKMSEVRREELQTSLYKGVQKIVNHIRSNKPLEPLILFQKPTPFDEVHPLLEASTGFAQKMAYSSQIWMDRFREDAQKIKVQIKVVSQTARLAYDTTSRDRAMIMQCFMTIDEHTETISNLKQTIAVMEKKEAARLADFAKKEKKAQAKQKEREAKLAALSNSKLVVGRPRLAPGGENKHALIERQQAASEQGCGGGLGPAIRDDIDMSFLNEVDKKKSVPVMINKSAPSTALLTLASRECRESDTEQEESEDEFSEVDPNEEIMDSMMHQISLLSIEVEKLHGEVEDAWLTIKKWEEKDVVNREERERSAKQIESAMIEYEAAIGRIRVLRQAVEDNYREKQREIEDLKKSHVEKELAIEKARTAAKRHKGTYISCSVCAIRHHGAAEEEDSVRDGSRSTQLTVHENLAEILGADVVLVTRPRAINRHRFSKSKKVTQEPHVDAIEATRTPTSGQWDQDPHPQWYTATDVRPSSAAAMLSSDKSNKLNQSQNSGAIKDSKFRTMRSIPVNTKQQDQQDADKAAARKAHKQAAVLAMDKSIPLNKNKPTARIEGQTAAYMQFNTLAKYGLGDARPKSGGSTALEMNHRALKGVPVRSLSASAMLLQLNKSLSAASNDMQANQKESRDPQEKWRLSDGSFDLGILEAELNGAEEEGIDRYFHD